MRKILWISLGFCSVLIIISVFVFWYLTNKAKNPDLPDIKIEPVCQVNYNNYMTDNRLDYKGNQFAWQNGSSFSPKLYLLNNDGEYTVHSGVTKPFQLLTDCVVFIKNNDLFKYQFSDQTEQRIAQKVSTFLATEDAVFYRIGSTLFRYHWTDANATELKDYVDQFYIHQDQLYIIDHNGCLMRLKDDGTWQELCLVQIEAYPFRVMPQGDFIITQDCNELVFTNIYTGARETIRLSQGDYANNQISFICNDQQLFVSFQATQTDGSIVRDIAHTDNGVWRFNSQTRRLEKLCDSTFDELYLFSDNELFGIKDGQLFQIDTKTGAVKAMT